MANKKRTKKQPQEPTQIITRPRAPIEICDKCGALMPFIKQRGPRDYTGISVWPAKCRNCGRIAQIREVRQA